MGKGAQEREEGPQVRGDAKGAERDKWAPNDRPTIAEERGRCKSPNMVASVIRLTNTLALLSLAISGDFRHTWAHLTSRTRTLIPTFCTCV